MACKWSPLLFQCSLLIKFAWTLRVLAKCGGTIFHYNIWNFSKCNENCKSVASDHNFFVSNALYDINLLQVITKCRNCSDNVVLWACAWQSAPTIHALPSTYALHVHARILSTPSHPRLEIQPISRRLWLVLEAVRAHARSRLCP